MKDHGVPDASNSLLTCSIPFHCVGQTWATKFYSYTLMIRLMIDPTTLWIKPEDGDGMLRRRARGTKARVVPVIPVYGMIASSI